MVELKIEDLADLLGKKRWEIEEMLKTSDLIELNLSERKPRHGREDDELKIFE